jgi:hypothetical protein
MWEAFMTELRSLHLCSRSFRPRLNPPANAAIRPSDFAVQRADGADLALRFYQRQ